MNRFGMVDRNALAARLARARPLIDPTSKLTEPVYQLVLQRSELAEIIAALRGQAERPSGA